MELADRGTLRGCLQNQALSLTWRDPKKKWAECIARGMSFIHSHSHVLEDNELSSGVIHRGER